ncbi:sodium-coupled monocarboxylate transporter 1 isoform X1 [Phymastichus coffea]|uniref:sodium-coupled monocarboxylate transporter 1 isoform X1 n=1 Tax=Phymastichus coffea TaxID=108790 RepID=UPI00273C6CCB|nr:sodium-coupled monocarboxylate transporter 1 isoform X1 [Phymastichus coffea]
MSSPNNEPLPPESNSDHELPSKFATVDMPSVQDVIYSLQNFGIVDYSIFVAMLAACGCIGVYFGFFKRSRGEDEYLVGGRNMKTFPVSMSLIASFISGISLLGTPTEIYMHGTSYLCIGFGVVLVGFIMSNVFLPVFHDLRLTSTYEYLEKRFDKKIRILGSVLFAIGIITWLPIVIYVPALAFNQVTGVNIHVVTPFVCVVCIFYTCVGGLRAVVWTDFVQIFIMFGAMILIVVKGTSDLGGFSTVLRRNFDSGRLELPTADWSPLTRHTIWSLVVGGCVHWLQISAINQNMIQRYLSLPSVEHARRALWTFIVGVLLLIGTCGYAGMLVYAWYHECDPLTTKLARAKDQLLPLLMMNVLRDLPGLPGLFVAGVFSAALSSLSTGLNSMAAVVLEDFVKPFRTRPFSPKTVDRLMKLTVLVLGVLCTCLVFVVEKTGSHVLQLSMSLSAITSGPSLGVFAMGVLLPWINANGALVGGLSGLSFMGWISLSAEAAIASGRIRFDEKPVSVEGCTYSFHQAENLLLLLPPETLLNDPEEGEPWAVYRLSYLWYTVAGTLVTMSVGLMATGSPTSRGHANGSPARGEQQKFNGALAFHRFFFVTKIKWKGDELSDKEEWIS